MPYKDPEKRKEYNKQYNRQHYAKNKEKILEHKKEYHQKNKEKILEYKKEYRENNKEQISKRDRQYKRNNKEKILAQQKEYYEKNKEKISKYRKEYEREKLQNDPVFRMIKNYRTRTFQAYKQGNKSKSTIELLGCTGIELANHLEKQFQEGMTHDNYGEWHIDHIKPIASFDLSDPEQEQACFHYTNLQPLWAIDNLKKGAKY